MLLAVVPLAAAIGSLLVLRWPAVRAALVGLGLGLGLTWLYPPFQRPIEQQATALLSGLSATVAVIYVIFGGLLLFQVMQRGGAIRRIADALAQLRAEATAIALVVVLGFAPFVEAASGFGVAASVSVPLLLALGFPRRTALLLGLLGLCAVPWGALSVGTALGAQLTSQPLAEVGATCALLSLPLFVLDATVTGWLAARRAASAHWPLALLLIGVLTTILWASSRWFSVELAGLLAGLATLCAGLLYLLRQRQGAAPTQPLHASAAHLSLARAATPYVLLLAGLIISRQLPGLRSIALLPLPSHPGLPLLISPGTWLILVAAVSVWLLGLPPATIWTALGGTARQWWRPAAATLGFVALGQLMDVSGMTARLAGGLAALGPPALLTIAPLGALGGFVTGSNAGANAMLATLISEAATRLDLSPVLALALLNTAAANATMAAPTRVLLALAVAGGSATERSADEVAVSGRMLMIVSVAVLLLVAVTGLVVASAAVVTRLSPVSWLTDSIP